MAVATELIQENARISYWPFYKPRFGPWLRAEVAGRISDLPSTVDPKAACISLEGGGSSPMGRLSTWHCWCVLRI